VGRYDHLAPESATFLSVLFDQAQDFSDEDLLQLGVQMGLGLFNKNQMQRRSVFFLGHPPGMQIENFYDHVNQVLKPQTIIRVRKPK
jgi:hypothetical protein